MALEPLAGPVPIGGEYDLRFGVERRHFSPYHAWGEGAATDKHFCSYPWRQLAILVDGQATACCVDAEGEISLGNANEMTVEEIWNGPAISRMRSGFWNHMQAVEGRCVRCPINHWDVEEKYRNHTLTS